MSKQVAEYDVHGENAGTSSDEDNDRIIAVIQISPSGNEEPSENVSVVRSCHEQGGITVEPVISIPTTFAFPPFTFIPEARPPFPSITPKTGSAPAVRENCEGNKVSYA